MDQAATVRGPVAFEELGYGDPEEEGEAGDEEVPHGVHVSELEK